MARLIPSPGSKQWGVYLFDEVDDAGQSTGNQFMAAQGFCDLPDGVQDTYSDPATGDMLQAGYWLQATPEADRCSSALLRWSGPGTDRQLGAVTLMQTVETSHGTGERLEHDEVMARVNRLDPDLVAVCQAMRAQGVQAGELEAGRRAEEFGAAAGVLRQPPDGGGSGSVGSRLARDPDGVVTWLGIDRHGQLTGSYFINLSTSHGPDGYDWSRHYDPEHQRAVEVGQWVSPAEEVGSSVRSSALLTGRVEPDGVLVIEDLTLMHSAVLSDDFFGQGIEKVFAAAEAFGGDYEAVRKVIAEQGVAAAYGEAQRLAQKHAVAGVSLDL